VFDRVLECWGSDEFPQAFKQAIKSLELEKLPLANCCNHSAVIDKDSIDVMILSSHETDDQIQIKIGVFFSARFFQVVHAVMIRLKQKYWKIRIVNYWQRLIGPMHR